MSQNCQLFQPRFSPWENWKSYILLLSRFYKLSFTFFPRISVSIKISSLNSFWLWRKEHRRTRGICSINICFYKEQSLHLTEQTWTVHTVIKQALFGGQRKYNLNIRRRELEHQWRRFVLSKDKDLTLHNLNFSIHQGKKHVLYDIANN